MNYRDTEAQRSTRLLAPRSSRNKGPTSFSRMENVIQMAVRQMEHASVPPCLLGRISCLGRACHPSCTIFRRVAGAGPRRPGNLLPKRGPNRPADLVGDGESGGNQQIPQPFVGARQRLDDRGDARVGQAKRHVLVGLSQPEVAFHTTRSGRRASTAVPTSSRCRAIHKPPLGRRRRTAGSPRGRRCSRSATRRWGRRSPRGRSVG